MQLVEGQYYNYDHNRLVQLKELGVDKSEVLFLESQICQIVSNEDLEPVTYNYHPTSDHINWRANEEEIVRVRVIYDVIKKSNVVPEKDLQWMLSYIADNAALNEADSHDPDL